MHQNRTRKLEQTLLERFIRRWAIGRHSTWLKTTGANLFEILGRRDPGRIPLYTSRLIMKLRLSISTAITLFGLIMAVGFASVVLTGAYALKEL